MNYVQRSTKEVKFSLGTAPCKNVWQTNWQACNQIPHPNTFKTVHVFFCDGLLLSILNTVVAADLLNSCI